MEKVILHFLNKGYGDLTEYRTDKYPDSIFYMKGKQVFMEQDLEHGILLVDYHTIWTDLENFFSFDHMDIKSIITKWVDQRYNITGVIPHRMSTRYFK